MLDFPLFLLHVCREQKPHKAIALDALEGLTVNEPRLSEIIPDGLTDEQLREVEAVGDACDSVLRQYVAPFSCLFRLLFS